jgi:Alw26I/Eco31I/Esp3I family type II restriction endonuclease
MSPEKRNWHPEFISYMKTIASHKNYDGMPEAFKEDGSVRWVVTGKSELGRQRLAWWNRKRDELGIEKDEMWPSKTARANHPTGRKPCQICGRELSLDYVYPTRNTVKKLNEELIDVLELEFEDLLELEEIINVLLVQLSETKVISILKRVFRIPASQDSTLEKYSKFILTERKTMLSPGAMSNCPDRFDGYHSYNKCCRSREDTGRHASNLRRYGEDRRAYENWSDGDWKAAAWLMREINNAGKKGICSICGKRGKVTADHLGPISLGFSVGDPPHLRPVCSSCNSGRNNRMSLADVAELREWEKNGINVVSWHTAYVWNCLKDRPKNNREAKTVSRLMRTNLHYVITLLGKIAEGGHDKFLVEKFLHPEYAFYSVDFEGFDPATGNYDRIIKQRGNIRQYSRNAERYVRISLESLDQYMEKSNRKFDKEHLKNVLRFADMIVRQLNRGNENEAMDNIDRFLQIAAKWAESDYSSRM